MGYQTVDIDGATQAPGSAAPGRGVQLLGSDGTNSRALLVDASGRPIITGAQADGAALAGNPVTIAGKEGSNARILLVDSSGRPLVTVATALPAGTNLVGKVQLRNPGDTVDLGDATNPIRTDPTGTTTQPISASSLPLPAGAATSANQATIIGHIDGLETLNANIQAVLEAIRDTAGVKKITDPLPAGNNNIGDVDIASSALPTGAATLAEQQTQTTALQLVDDIVHATNAALSKVAAIGGQMDDASITDATENNVAPVRITAKRALHTALHDALGNAISSLLDGAIRRIQVESAIAPGQSISIGAPVPENPTNIIRQKLLNGGSSNLLVDGDPTPIVFILNADSTDDIKIGEIRLVFSSTAINMDGNSFGADPDLTNGCLLEVNAGGNLVTLANIIRNEDFLSFPGGLPFLDRSGVQDILAVSYTLGGAVKLIAGSGDFVRMTIRDDIDGTSYKLFEATVYGVKV